MIVTDFAKRGQRIVLHAGGRYLARFEGRPRPLPKMRRSRSAPVLLVAAFALAVAAGLLARGGDWFGSLERSSIDTRFAIGHPAVDATKDIVIVNRSATTERFQSPRIPRRYQARMIDLLRRGGAAVIAYDLSSSAPRRTPTTGRCSTRCSATRA